jgi:uncharacterized membrane protein YdjX (TVP38/TMEM64 family)
MKVRIKSKLVNNNRKRFKLPCANDLGVFFGIISQVPLGGSSLNKSARLGFYLLNIIIVIMVGAVIYLLVFTENGSKLTHTNINELAAYLRSYGAYAMIFGIMAIILQTFIPFSPFILIAGANVLVFGFMNGLIINYISACVGALLAFLFARYLGRDWVERKMARFPAMRQFNIRMETEGFFYILLGRLISFFPSSIVNYGGGISKVKLRDFISATLLGKFPIIFMECMIAHDLQNWRHYRGRLVLLLCFFILLIILGNWIRKRSLRRNQ